MATPQRILTGAGCQGMNRSDHPFLPLAEELPDSLKLFLAVQEARWLFLAARLLILAGKFAHRRSF